MAVKFSEFSAKLDASVDVTEVVGYLTSGELNVRIPPANLDTTYVVSTGNAGASPTINLQGTKAGQAAAISPSTVSLTGSGATLLAGNGSTTIDFASTAYALSATDNADPAQNTPVVLTGTGGGDAPVVLTGTGGGDAGTDTVNLIGASGVGVTSSSGTITITGPGSGSNTTYTVDVPTATTNINLAGSDGSNDAITLVGGTDIQLVRDSASQITINSQAVGGVTSVDETTPGTSSGTPIVVNPTTGTVLVKSMAFAGAANVGHVPTSAAVAQTTHFLRADGTWQIAGGLPTKTVDQVTISNATTGTVSLSVSPSSEAYTDMYVSGVYQNKSVYSLSGSTITLDSSAYFPNGSIVEVVSTT